MPNQAFGTQKILISKQVVLGFGLLMGFVHSEKNYTLSLIF